MQIYRKEQNLWHGVDKRSNDAKLASLRIITQKRLLGYGEKHARARSSLQRWHDIVHAAKWEDFSDIRRTFRSADHVRVKSGRTVVVFNIGGNEFRLITAIHFNTANVYVLRLLTHAECDKNRWKDEL